MAEVVEEGSLDGVVVLYGSEVDRNRGLGVDFLYGLGEGVEFCAAGQGDASGFVSVGVGLQIIKRDVAVV